ncbi:hypothetical protein DY000_02009125 [Brassica cretica]|uniref:Uncharacterized protein n=1 Tax=Brassica cretica TaxID=69181 RepID=A0ABQ7CC89_BRACR|nr:hypothetical protein DY000_02009125 [Brassica cretica]
MDGEDTPAKRVKELLMLRGWLVFTAAVIEIVSLMSCCGITDMSFEDAPKSNGEADSSTDEEQPANRRRIEVILSQQTLSSDDENDDTPVLKDLRDVLKRKLEPENSNSSTRNDLRTTLNARKSRRISAVDPNPKERSNGDLRDKLNAGACDLRIRLNRSKPTDLRRRLEQTRCQATTRRHKKTTVAYQPIYAPT